LLLIKLGVPCNCKQIFFTFFVMSLKWEKAGNLNLNTVSIAQWLKRPTLVLEFWVRIPPQDKNKSKRLNFVANQALFLFYTSFTNERTTFKNFYTFKNFGFKKKCKHSSWWRQSAVAIFFVKSVERTAWYRGTLILPDKSYIQHCRILRN